MQSSPVILHSYPNSLILEKRVTMKNAKDAEGVLVMQIGEWVTGHIHWALEAEGGMRDPICKHQNTVNHH